MPADKLVAVVQNHQPQVSQAGPAASVRCKPEAPTAECHMGSAGWQQAGTVHAPCDDV